MPRQSVVDLPPSSIRMMFNAAAGMEDVLQLSISHSDFATPQPVIEAMVEALRQGKTRYALDLGVLEFPERICAYFSREHGLELTPEEVLVRDGDVEAITLFDGTGMAIQDAAIARRVYDLAEREGFGVWAEL